jgi:TPR repeat protein
MRNLTANLCLILAVLLGSAGLSWSADFQKGLSAYNSGDYTTALREWKPLANQGNATAQNNLAAMYDNGQGVPQDYTTAVKWYTLAAKQGNADAQYNLGAMYSTGQGVGQDYRAAVKWYTFSAKQGDAGAQTNLGGLYANGRGVRKNNVYAYMWLDIAVSSGKSTNASKNRDIVAKRMTSTQIAEARNLARECVRKKYKGC